MEEFGGTRLDGIGNTVRKKRSRASRRPRPESQPHTESWDHSSTPPSDDVCKVSSDENAACDASSRRKEFNLNQCAAKAVSVGRAECESPNKRIKKEDGGCNAMFDCEGLGDSNESGLRDNNEQGRGRVNNKRCSEGVLAPANWKSIGKVKESPEPQSRATDHPSQRNGESQSSRQSGVDLDGSGHESKVKKVKLKVGGVTRTIQAQSLSNGAASGGSSRKSSRSSDAPRPRQKLILQDNSDDSHSPPDKRSGLQGIPWRDFSRGGFSLGKEDSSMGKISGKQGDKSDPVRKSKRVPKRRVLDGAFDDDEDDEIRYLEKLKTSKVTAGHKDDEEESGKKPRRVSKMRTIDGKKDENLGSSKDGKKKSRSDRVSEDTDYEEEQEDEEVISDSELEENKMKKLRKESVDSLSESKREMTLTTRQRALQSGKDASSAPGASLIEFPNGLPPAPSRKQKEKLSEVEQQLKKAEAAQRRKMQVEKAARESEAEAIRKILGQDSGRKKREDKMKKRREELAQERAANALTLPSNTIRCVMGPTGTVLTFSKDMGLPSLFDPKPCNYPPPREKCAGPSCTNPYKYRDSKSKLPLCSLHCYKAIHKRMQAETTC
ncbi:hypothetical protein CK203_068249 [Vitis vinifera]|uniref:INO80 complex subunit B-like conserved region domain-containing protein n=1 Tax=Vitis vinifera TaxID=29760 RepID=A0A438E1S8_VITVI|nr:hypothetical protein CK203_068249 [Vitis vinifera]